MRCNTDRNITCEYKKIFHGSVAAFEREVRMSHEKLFRPSNASKLELCVFFEALLTEGKRAKAGSEGHKYFAQVFRMLKTVDQISSTWRKRCRWAIRVQKKYCPHIIGVEDVLDLYDEDEQWLTDGTLDLWGRDELGQATVIDWKPGAYMDHSAQGTVYGLMLMDHLNEEVVQVVTGYYGTEQVRSDLVSYASAAARVETLIQRIRRERGPEIHEINPWCGMCRLKTDGCSAWEEYRKTFLSTPGIPPELGTELAAIKRDPERLGAFIVTKKRFDSLVEAHGLEDEAKRLLEGGEKVPGLKLQSRGYSVVIDKHYNGKEPQLALEIADGH